MYIKIFCKICNDMLLTIVAIKLLPIIIIITYLLTYSTIL